MRLYHFTSTLHLPLIEAAGVLTVTDPNLFKTGPMPGRPDIPYRGPGVVWLLDTPHTTSEQHGLKGYVDKSAVRIVVDVPDARRWLDWLQVRNHDPEWVRRVLRMTPNGTQAAKHWWVVARPIPRAEWLSIDIKETHP